MKLNDLVINIKPEKTFIILAFIFGLILTFMTPPFQVADEISHFYRTYELSELNIIAKKINNQSGDYIPADIIKMVEVLSGDITYHTEQKFDYSKLKNYCNVKINLQNKQFADFRNTAIYSPVVYLPQVTGMAVAKLTDCPVFMIYLGRIFNLFTFIAMGYFAIKLTPVCKWGFTLLSLMPMTIYQAASLSADALCFGVSFLFIAYILDCALKKEKTGNKQLVVILILSILLALCKSAYFAMIFLFFLIPYRKIGSRQKYFGLFFIMLLLTVSVNIIWAAAVKEIYVPMQLGVSPVAQFLYVLHSPLNFIAGFLKNIVNIKILYSFVGCLGWLEVHLPVFLVGMFLIMTVLSCLFDENKNIILSLQQRIIILLTALLNVMLIYFFIYLSFNKIGASNIIGIQGRYFIPVAPLFLLLFHNKFITGVNLINKGGNLILACFLIVSLLITVFCVLQRYYIPWI